MSTVSAIVLAGGRSTRFGSDKARAKFRGRPLLQHVVDAVSSVAGEVVLVAAPGRPLPPVNVAGSRIISTQDPDEGHGPLAGLAAGFHAATGDACLAVSTDAPLLVPALLDGLVHELRRHDVVLPVVGGYRQPLVAAYRRSTCGPAVARAFESGQRRILAALDGLDVLEVDEAWARAFDADLLSFRNANTPAALAELEPLGGGPP